MYEYIYATTKKFQNVNIEEININYSILSSFRSLGCAYWSVGIQINKNEKKWVYFV
jgi:hypothetical protein